MIFSYLISNDKWVKNQGFWRKKIVPSCPTCGVRWKHEWGMLERGFRFSGNTANLACVKGEFAYLLLICLYAKFHKCAATNTARNLIWKMAFWPTWPVVYVSATSLRSLFWLRRRPLPRSFFNLGGNFAT